jgi:epoxyqueuosine reductase
VSCPSGAIGTDLFPIQQDRCLTFYCGYSGVQAIPDWLNPAWLECLIGCMRCQRACPENRQFLGWIEEGETFNEEETELLYCGLTSQTVTTSIRQKLERLGLIQFFGVEECLEMIASKLKVFSERRKGRKG